MPGFPVQPYTVNPAANLVGSPILADVNGDGYLEILVPSPGALSWWTATAGESPEWACSRISRTSRTWAK